MEERDKDMKKQREGEGKPSQMILITLNIRDLDGK